jgi:hypothetical protein
MPPADDRFDPLAILGALERHRVAYVLIGALARVIHGTDELTTGVDITPQRKPDNLERLATCLTDLQARPATGRSRRLDLAPVEAGEITAFRSPAGRIRVVPEPAGTRRGYDDLRRKATREPLGQGVRASVASIGDLARRAAALGRDQDEPILAQLRRLQEIDGGIRLQF